MTARGYRDGLTHRDQLAEHNVLEQDMFRYFASSFLSHTAGFPPAKTVPEKRQYGVINVPEWC